MRYFTFRLLIAVTTFAVGVLAVAGWFLYFTPEPQIPRENIELVCNLRQPPIRFIPTQRACKPGWAQLYETSDGKKLSESVYPYDSPAAARAALEADIKDAVKVVERVVFDGVADKAAHEKVLAIQPANEFWPEEWVEAIWLDGSVLRRICAPTLHHLDEFERQNNNR